MQTAKIKAFHHPETLFPIAVWGLLLVAMSLPGTAMAGEHKIGVGAHFWRTVDEFADDILNDPFDDLDEDGFAWIVSYQYVPKGLFRIELDVEYYDGGFGGSPDSSYSPIGFLLFGGNIYAGVGVGFTVSSGLEDDVSDPFYAARVGWEIDLLPGVSVDINANYRADTFANLDRASSDTITLGAIVRLNL